MLIFLRASLRVLASASTLAPLGEVIAAFLESEQQKKRASLACAISLQPRDSAQEKIGNPTSIEDDGTPVVPPRASRDTSINAPRLGCKQASINPPLSTVSSVKVRT